MWVSKNNFVFCCPYLSFDFLMEDNQNNKNNICGFQKQFCPLLSLFVFSFFYGRQQGQFLWFQKTILSFVVLICLFFFYGRQPEQQGQFLFSHKHFVERCEQRFYKSIKFFKSSNFQIPKNISLLNRKALRRHVYTGAIHCVSETAPAIETRNLETASATETPQA